MMLYVVMIYLWTALLVYLLMGGADFGAGIIELFTSSKNKGSISAVMYKAIGPIWEANHMWLIIAIVILFVGFPDIYTTMSVYLHIPLVIMLMGIIARGTAFTFRHYDAVKDQMQKVYTRIYIYSSFITPMFLGIIAGSAVSGKIDVQATTFRAAYIDSWLSWFPVSVGLFTVTLCGYLAAVYLIGEAKNEDDRRRFVKKTRQMNSAAFIAGGLVFLSALYEHIPLIYWVFGNPVGISAIGAASFSLVLLWFFIARGKDIIIRVLAGFQVTMILLTTTYIHYPNIVTLKNGAYLSLLSGMENDRTIYMLGLALLTGSMFILPALGFLIYSFQKQHSTTDETPDYSH